MTSSTGLPNPEAPGGSQESPGPECFLGVEKSLTGKRWIGREADDRQSLALAQRLNLPEIVGRVLAARGIGLDQAGTFLNPTLKDLLPDPSLLKAMDDGADRLTRAIMDDEKIGIFGDYDVDGATSAALLTRFFKAVGGRSVSYIPDRLKEGYGPNTPALMKLKDEGVSIIRMSLMFSTHPSAMHPIKTFGCLVPIQLSILRIRSARPGAPPCRL